MEERDSQQEGRWNTPNSVKIGQEVRFKTPFLVEYSSQTKINFTNYRVLLRKYNYKGRVRGRRVPVFNLKFKMSARVEPATFNSNDIHESFLEIFANKQWINFFEKFNGHNEQDSLAFAETFNGERARIGNLQIRLS